MRPHINNILNNIGGLLAYKPTIEKPVKIIVFVYRQILVISLSSNFGDKSHEICHWRKELMRAGATTQSEKFSRH